MANKLLARQKSERRDEPTGLIPKAGSNQQIHADEERVTPCGLVRHGCNHPVDMKKRCTHEKWRECAKREPDLHVSSSEQANTDSMCPLEGS